MANEKQQFVDELKALLQNDVTEVKEQVEQLKTQFYRQYHQDLEAQRVAAQQAAEEAGETLENWVPQVDETEQEFRELLAEYKNKKAELLKKAEEEQNQNLLRKENILQQMKEMAEAETADVMDNIKKMKELQAEWKTIGAVPPAKTQGLWKSYQQYQEQFYDLVKINIELRDLDFKKNLEIKTQLCEAAEKLQDHNNVVEASRMLQQLHNEWAETGPVARELREELWNRFKQASSVINKKHQAYFDELHAQENENLEKKQALIAQLKEINLDKLKSNKQWDEATEKVQQIQQEWRTIGFAPKKQNQTVYEEYRQICDTFFKAKTNYYKSLRDEFADNLKRKRQLVEEAQALKDDTNWKETTEKLQELQKQWKEIGPVARKYSDELWKMFTTACDTFFEAKRIATKEAREAFAQKRAEAKERWNKKVDQMTDRQKLVKMYENLVQEIKTAENNILFFTGNSKTANKLVEDMRKKIDTLKQQLNDLENKINQLDAE
ncbi:MAG: DUF349 domain-containing protein [Paludibacteraceae bacterium]|nr:DUF349 domain-containing protein [Paludibacteraceae bacterium]